MAVRCEMGDERMYVELELDGNSTPSTPTLASVLFIIVL
jgi:hypothetical protein